MAHFTTLHYNDFVGEGVAQPPVSNVENSIASYRHTSDNTFWGKFEEERISIPFVEIIRRKTELNNTFKVIFSEDDLFNVVNLCLCLKGTTRVVSNDANFDVSLGRNRIHGCYIPAMGYDVYVDKVIDNIHFAIDRNYFLDLLNHSEPWADGLRKKIEGKVTISPGSIELTAVMQRIVMDILNCPLDGCLKKLIIEGKTLELIALNLGHFVSATSSQSLNVRKRDHDIFYAIRCHLDKTFMEEHSLKSIGKSFGVNEFKLKSGFREMYGTTIFDYIHDRKMEHARELLLDAGFYVNEVSRKVGYKNPNHFSTAFKKKFGVSPARLR